MDEAKGLFHRAIVQSGGQNFTYDKARMDENQQVETLMKLTAAKNMADLVAIPEKEFIEYYTTPDEEGATLCDDYPMPLRNVRHMGNLRQDR